MERKPISEFILPPGFRFHPSDEELIIHYLQNKVFSRALPAYVIAEVNLYKHNPWELPKKALFGEGEWYFFSPRDRKYPNGARPNRAAASGYWKATGTDKPILGSTSKIIGVKKALVFYTGRPPRGLKTEWIMNEFRLLDTKFKPSKSKGSMRLDDWVLCRVRQRGNTMRNTYDAQDRPIKEFVGYLPVTEELDLASTNYNNEMIKDCVRKDCRLLASILAGQSLSPMATFPYASLQESVKDDSFISFYEDGRHKVHSPEAVPPFDNHDPLPRKSNEVDRYDESLLPYMELYAGNRNEDVLPDEDLLPNEDLLPIETIPNSYVNYYSQNLSQDGFCNSNPAGSINGFLELNELAFLSKYLQ